jgi:site-specific recombinase XerD
MTPWRKRMIEARQLRGMSERTQEMSVRAVHHLADSDHTSPDPITEDARRQDCLALKHVTPSSRSASPLALCGRQFFSEHLRKREGSTLPFVRAPRPQKLPVLLRVAEGRPRLTSLKLLRSRACLTTMDACGLRRHAGPHLQGPDRDSARLFVHVRSGQGAHDRSVPRPPRTRALLRPDWTTPRHPPWRLPAPGRGRIGLATASAPMPRHRVQEACRVALQQRGLPTHASVQTLRHR